MIKTAHELIAMINGQGYTAYIAGGAVRDILLEREPNDIDISTSATPTEMVECHRQSAIGKNFELVSSLGNAAEFGTMVFIRDCDHIPFEVTTFRSDGIYLDGRHPSGVEFTEDPHEDCRRRDFTINAMLMDTAGKVYDFFGGQTDLDAGIIRTVGDPQERFKEDRLRIMRAIRFAARYGFVIENETWEAIQSFASDITACSWERIRTELRKILTEGNAEVGFRLLDESGILEHILPELTEMNAKVDGKDKYPQSKKHHSEGNPWMHTLLVLSNLEAGVSEEVAWAALFHDVGKPKSFVLREKPEGLRPTYYRHEQIGAEMAWGLMQRLRMPVSLTKNVSWIISNHMIPHLSFTKMKKSKKMLILNNPLWPYLLDVCRLDCLGSIQEDGTNDVHTIDEVVEWCEQHKELIGLPKRFVNGDDLIVAGHTPGQEFGRILEKLYMLQLEDKIRDKDHALKWAQGMFKGDN